VSGPFPNSPPPVSPPVFRWLVLAALLSGEVWLLQWRFDATDTLFGRHEWWAELLKDMYLLPRFVVAVAAATLLVGGVPLWHELRRLPVPPVSLGRSGMLFLGHLAALAAFAATTALLLEGKPTILSKSTWTVLWLVLGLAVVGLWALLVLPARLWLQLVQRRFLLLLAGFGVGVVAFSAGLLLASYWVSLAKATLWLVYVFLRLAYDDVVYQPDEQVVGTSTFSVEISFECCGYAGIGMLSIFAAAYLWLSRRCLRFPQALLLWPAGVVLLWLGNAVRIAVLIAFGTEGRPDIALGGFHAQAGWLAFDAVALGLVLSGRRLRFFAAVSPQEQRADGPTTIGPHPATAYLGPFLALLAASMVATTFTAGFDVLYPLRVLAAAAVLWKCRHAYAELHGSLSWQPFALGTVVFVVWIALVPSGIGQPSPLRDGLARLSPAWAAIWLLFRLAGATITVPLAEELAFRGYLLRRLHSADWHELPSGQFSWTALLLSSLLFGLLHDHWLAGTLAGLLYGLAVWHRGQLLDAVLAHATTNALLAGYVLTTGAWALWS
jgi:exosortase E/protease (VPEID-CTERM system)